jgi:amidase
LGKTNLSEWANFLCLECPNGYSAVGGQTLNPYGRKNSTLEAQALEVLLP